MKLPRSVLVLVMVTFIATFPTILARDHVETWTAWVSDEHCGASHTKPGGADCIRKCHRGGASVGHPEWTPQRLVLVKDADKTVWVVENPATLDGHEGHRVRVSVDLNRKKKTVHVRSVKNAD